MYVIYYIATRPYALNLTESACTSNKGQRDSVHELLTFEI